MREDWIEVELKEVFEIVTGNTPSKKDSDNYGNQVPFVKPPNLWNGFVTETQDYLTEKGAKKSRILPPYSVLVTCIGNLGRVGINKNMVAFNQQINALKPNVNINSLFIFFQAQSPDFKLQLEQKSSATTVAIVNKGSFETIRIKIAPLPIQRAIVSKIESLFSDLDNGIADLKKAQGQLKIYRQAVLKKAFEGGYSEKEYEFKKIASLCEVVRGGSPRPAGSPLFYDGPIPFMKVKDISRNTGIYLYDAEHSIKEAGFKKTRLVVSDTLLLTNSGATLGIPAITRIKTTFNDGIAAFLGLDKTDLLYHYYFWCSKTIYLRNLNQGAAQPNLNTDIIGDMDIPVYHEKGEHIKIVREIESRLSVCEKVEQSITEALVKAEALRQSILKKAFEGKLLSHAEIEKCKQEADYEPAKVLLEKIRKGLK